MRKLGSTSRTYLCDVSIANITILTFSIDERLADGLILYQSIIYSTICVIFLYVLPKLRLENNAMSLSSQDSMLASESNLIKENLAFGC